MAPLKISQTLTDVAILAELGSRIARHRLEQNLTQAALAREAGVSKRTLIRIEAGESTQLVNLLRVARALKLLSNLEAFVPAPAPSPVRQVRQRVKERKRASSPRVKRGRPKGWVWGDDKIDGGES